MQNERSLSQQTFAWRTRAADINDINVGFVPFTLVVPENCGRRSAHNPWDLKDMIIITPELFPTAALQYVCLEKGTLQEFHCKLKSARYVMKICHTKSKCHNINTRSSEITHKNNF